MKTKQKGFTLVEIMIVVGIIGVLAAVAIPHYLRSRKIAHCNSCITNMKELEGAREQALMVAAPSINLSVLCGPSSYVKHTPVCPATKAGYSVDTTSLIVCPNPTMAGSESEFVHSLYK
jgi:type IV pilus assembly protein PilA